MKLVKNMGHEDSYSLLYNKPGSSDTFSKRNKRRLVTNVPGEIKKDIPGGATINYFHKITCEQACCNNPLCYRVVFKAGLWWNGVGAWEK